MRSLSRQRCFNHVNREAAAQCRECHRFFCRECATEHDDRMTCAACLKKLTATSSPAAQRFAWVLRSLFCLLAVSMLWAFFYLAGLGLLALPASFHEGTLWQQEWWEAE